MNFLEGKKTILGVILTVVSMLMGDMADGKISVSEGSNMGGVLLIGLGLRHVLDRILTALTALVAGLNAAAAKK